MQTLPPSGIMVRLEEYSRRLYEEENDISSRLNGSSKNLFLILTGTVASAIAIVKWFIPNPTTQLLTWENWVIGMLLAIGLLVAIASFVLIVSALHVRTLERHCDPIDLAGRSAFFRNEDELLAEIISNQLVASGRNYDVNQKKARVLSRAYFCYFFSTASIVVAALIAAVSNM